MTITNQTGKALHTDRPAGRDAADWLGLAAAPVFAAMTGITAMEAPGYGVCAAVPGFEALHGMAWMYGSMTVFHLPPWLRLSAGNPLRRRQSTTQTKGM